MSQTEACRIFGMGPTSIHNWLKAHQKGGDAAFKSHKRAPKHQSRLAGHQAATVVRLISDRCPDQLKLPFVLWTRDAVRQLIEKRYGISVSVWTVGRYFKHWGDEMGMRSDHQAGRSYDLKGQADGTTFDHNLFYKIPNRLRDFVPEAAAFEDTLRVWTPSDQKLHILSDLINQKTIVYQE